MTILKVENLSLRFPIRSGFLLRETASVKAVTDVSFDLMENESLGLVGESGCGKSSLSRTLVGLYKPSEGDVYFRGHSMKQASRAQQNAFKRQVQMVFQDHYSSLNPRMTVATIIRRPLDVHRIGAKDERQEKVIELLDKVGLGSWAANRYPHEFSGGQRQRIAIARAIAIKPQILVADEPVSALDVSVQAQILNLLDSLRRELQMSVIFVGHNLAVVQHMADRIAVMYLGRFVEVGAKDVIFRQPKHPYTQALLAANPQFKRGKVTHRATLQGDVPSPIHPPQGCAFHPRCPYAMDRCKKDLPNLKAYEGEHLAACHLLDT